MKIKIACLQMDIAFGDPSKNYQAAERLIVRYALREKPEILVLPEFMDNRI